MCISKALLVVSTLQLEKWAVYLAGFCQVCQGGSLITVGLYVDRPLRHDPSRRALFAGRFAEA